MGSAAWDLALVSAAGNTAQDRPQKVAQEAEPRTGSSECCLWCMSKELCRANPMQHMSHRDVTRAWFMALYVWHHWCLTPLENHLKTTTTTTWKMEGIFLFLLSLIGINTNNKLFFFIWAAYKYSTHLGSCMSVAAVRKLASLGNARLTYNRLFEVVAPCGETRLCGMDFRQTCLISLFFLIWGKKRTFLKSKHLAFLKRPDFQEAAPTSDNNLSFEPVPLGVKWFIYWNLMLAQSPAICTIQVNYALIFEHNKTNTKISHSGNLSWNITEAYSLVFTLKEYNHKNNNCSSTHYCKERNKAHQASFFQDINWS